MKPDVALLLPQDTTWAYYDNNTYFSAFFVILFMDIMSVSMYTMSIFKATTNVAYFL